MRCSADQASLRSEDADRLVATARWLPMTKVSLGIVNGCPACWSLPARQASQRLSNRTHKVIETIDQGADGSDLLTDTYGRINSR